MTTMATAGLPTTVPTALGMTADHIETHGLIECAEWSLSVSASPRSGARSARSGCVGLEAQWDG